MITQSFEATIKHLDLPNKCYDEYSVKKFYFCGIRVFKRTYNKIEVMPKDEAKIGFNK